MEGNPANFGSGNQTANSNIPSSNQNPSDLPFPNVDITQPIPNTQVSNQAPIGSPVANATGTTDPNSNPLAPEQTVGYLDPTLAAPQDKPKKPKKKLIIIGLLIFLFIFLTGSAVAAYSVAYEKINIGNPELQSKISNFVQSLPFTPKTSKYILLRMVKAQDEVDKVAFDISASFDADDLLSGMGLNKLDFATTGNIDYSDPNNLKADVQIDLTKGATLLLKKIDDSLYFNVQELPEFLLTVGLASPRSSHTLAG